MVTQREQWAGLSQEGKRRFDKFGEERKGILLGKTDQGPPIINPPKIQPDPWINSVILRGHCPLLQHYQYMTTQRKGMNNTVHLTGPTLVWIIAFMLLFFGCSAHILSPSAAVCVKHELHFKTVHQKHQQSNMEVLLCTFPQTVIYMSTGLFYRSLLFGLF